MRPHILLALLSILALAAPRAAAEEPWATDAESVSKELFFRGVKLLDAGDHERALDAFLRSRATLPRKGNTVNAAICLERLERYDEALELYEDVLSRFSADMPEGDRDGLKKTMARLRGRVGALSVTANVTGASVQVDGRARGTVPLTADLRLTRGEHVVRVVKNGYETFSSKVDIRVGERTALDVRLEPLTRSGQLRIEVEDGGTADVFVDAALVGSAPWEGLLAPGRHSVWVRRGDVGSAPASLVVVAGQVSLARLGLAPLGSDVEVRVTPRTAELSIDGVPVGSGAWEGRLPRGLHRVAATEPGYAPSLQEIDARDPTRPVSLDVKLVVDPEHPRWPQRATGRFWLGASASYAGTGVLGSGAEASCLDDCVSDPPANGALLLGRVGYRFPIGVSIELGGGWMGLTKRLFRVEHDTFVAGGSRHDVRYDLEDRLALSGPVVLFGASYGIHVGWRIDLLARVAGGVLVARASDAISATAQTNGPVVAASVFGAPSEVDAVVPLVVPELGLELTLGDARLGAGLGVAFLPLAGPDYGDRALGVAPLPNTANPGAVTNAPQSDVVGSERSFGWVPIFLPGLSFRYEL